jgi:hypothetical protein
MNNTLIPKTIHYCWLSGEEMPEIVLKCMDSWKKHLPEYKLVLWDMNKFDVGSHIFVAEACQVKKWAFASDYIRLYALYTEGGIYLDTDVYVKKKFDDLLGNGFFTGIEYNAGLARKSARFLNKDGLPKDKYRKRTCVPGVQLQAAIMGGVKGHPFFKSCMDWYEGKHFILKNGTYFNKLIAPDIYAHVALDYGFRYKNEVQKLSRDMMIYPSPVFAGSLAQAEEDCYAVHCCDGAWRSKWYKAVLKLKTNNFVRAALGKKKFEKNIK